MVWHQSHVVKKAWQHKKPKPSAASPQMPLQPRSARRAAEYKLNSARSAALRCTAASLCQQSSCTLGLDPAVHLAPAAPQTSMHTDASVEEVGVFELMLTTLQELIAELRITQPCLVKVQALAKQWMAVVSSEHLEDLCGVGFYDHAAFEHFVGDIRRWGGLILFACFADEHDNGLLRRARQQHSAGNANGAGHDLVEVFIRHFIIRCAALRPAFDEVHAGTKQLEARKAQPVPRDRHCQCDGCMQLAEQLDAEAVQVPPRAAAAAHVHGEAQSDAQH